ncbi:class I SAM-dependent methyltransferase [Fodinibius sp. Rm-B-1B1-1]|uniref:class I SAM-dependent methyltransferase n=1 Tax=Fodinibius alkaliphilus TaxID=3140241 RepID=UPI00315AF692
MSKKKIEEEFGETDLQELARQLRTPKGQEGIAMGQKMNETNIGMTLAAIDALDISNGDILLEIGHGNAGHVEKILSRAGDLRYFGLDISETMKREAQRINKKYINNQQASFHLYDGHRFPFSDVTFHKAMTVNTIYFWEKPSAILKEVYRVLQPQGYFSIGFAQKNFMKQLPFVEYGFKLYNTSEVRKLVEGKPFQISTVKDQTEEVTSKDGSLVERTFTIITLVK